MAAVLRRCVCCSNLARSLFMGKNGYLANIARSKKDSWLMKGLLSAQIVQDRRYASSNKNKDKEYEKLWAAVTGGRGAGRGKKKVIIKGVDPEVLKFDKAGLKWQGFNAPVKRGKEQQRSLPADEEPERPVRLRRIFERGWTGRTWPGRKCGHPVTPDGEELTNFMSVVVDMRRVSNMTSGGRKKTQRAMVVTGNYNGVAGFGIGRGQTPISAIREARNRAANYLYFIERCENHTIYHDLETTYHKTKINFFRKPRGYGLRCHRLIKEIAVLLGIQDMRCKVQGPTTAVSLVRAAFQGLLSQETHQQLADRTGLNVVEFRAECGMRPVIVASPSEEAQNKVLKKRSEKAEYDLNEVFDPYRGLHRPKKVEDLF
ncbi:hypothetical protein ACROYT_G042008 [Oculina patagonica]